MVPKSAETATAYTTSENGGSFLTVRPYFCFTHRSVRNRGQLAVYLRQPSAELLPGPQVPDACGASFHGQYECTPAYKAFPPVATPEALRAQSARDFVNARQPRMPMAMTTRPAAKAPNS